jgi:hypothetical protein
MRYTERIFQIAYDRVASTITAVKTFTAAPVFNALPTGTAVVGNAATASTLVARDSGGGITATNFYSSFQSVSSAPSNTLVLDGTKHTSVVGGTITTVTLPSSFFFGGYTLKVVNVSSGALTINASGGTLVKSLAAGASTTLTALQNTPTTNAHWNAT